MVTKSKRDLFNKVSRRRPFLLNSRGRGSDAWLYLGAASFFGAGERRTFTPGESSAASASLVARTMRSRRPSEGEHGASAQENVGGKDDGSAPFRIITPLFMNAYRFADLTAK